jgi:hypothetical protein
MLKEVGERHGQLTLPSASTLLGTVLGRRPAKGAWSTFLGTAMMRGLHVWPRSQEGRSDMPRARWRTDEPSLRRRAFSYALSFVVFGLLQYWFSDADDPWYQPIMATVIFIVFFAAFMEFIWWVRRKAIREARAERRAEVGRASLPSEQSPE